jgi:hypothetical protein
MKKVLLITFATVLSSIVFGQQLDSVKHTIDKDGNTYETRYYSPMVKINNKTPKIEGVKPKNKWAY